MVARLQLSSLVKVSRIVHNMKQSTKTSQEQHDDCERRFTVGFWNSLHFDSNPIIKAGNARYWSNGLTAAYRAMKAVIQTIADPSSWEEALRSDSAKEWIAAAEKEFKSLEEHGVFYACPLPKGQRSIGCKMVFKTKYDSEGKIDKLKCRFVAKGFLQREGIDYHETFAPVLHYKTLRTLLAIATALDMEIRQGDVPTAFLNAVCAEELYMKIPEAMKSKYPAGSVYRLMKTLYGIKQAPRAWNSDLDETIKSMGYSRCVKDTCVYIKRSRTGKQIILPIFVDDIFPMCMTADVAEMEADLKTLMDTYKIPSFHEIDVVLGMRITRDRKHKMLKMDQEVYVKQLLESKKLSTCNSRPCPELVNEEKVHKKVPTDAQKEKIRLREEAIERELQEEGAENDDNFGSTVGALLYAGLSTRPDIAHACSTLARSLGNPQNKHYNAARRVLKYLRGTPTLGIVYGGPDVGTDNTLGPVYCDANWGGTAGSDRKSTTGYVIKLNGGPISWGSKKQPTVSTSTAEAEYMAAGAVAQEVMWTRQLLNEMGFDQLGPTIIQCDNLPAISMTNDDTHHPRTKHIDIKYHYIKSLVKEGEVKVEHIAGIDQQADMFTKPLSSTKFVQCRDLVMSGNNIMT